MKVSSGLGAVKKQKGFDDDCKNFYLGRSKEMRIVTVNKVVSHISWEGHFFGYFCHFRMSFFLFYAVSCHFFVRCGH